MRKILLSAAILFSISTFGNTINPAAVISMPQLTITHDPGIREIKSLKVKDIQKLLGRKLTLKEKIVFLILKKKLRKQEDGKSSGQTAFVIGIIGLVLLIAGLFIPYVIVGALAAGIVAIVTGTMAKKKDPDDLKAKAGTLMGWITVGAIAFLLILAAIVIASWSWGW